MAYSMDGSCQEPEGEAARKADGTVLAALSREYAAVFLVDLHTQALTVCRMTGYFAQDAVGIIRDGGGYTTQFITWYTERFVAAEDVETVRAMTQPAYLSARLAKEPRYTVRHRVQDNACQSHYFELCVMRAGTGCAVWGFRCVDKQVEREESCQQAARQEVEETLEGARIGLWRIELETGCPPRMYPDKTTRMLLGVDERISPEDCYTHWQGRIHTDYLGVVQECLDAALQDGRGEASYPWEHPLLGRIHIRCGSVLNRDFPKEGACLRGYLQDITDTMAVREKQERALLEALLETEQASAAKTEFLSHMSHDIRTPINGILGMLTIAEKNPDNIEKIWDCHQKIRTAAQHLLSLINDVLDISRLESGQLDMAQEPFRMADDVLDGCMPMLHAQAEKQGFVFTEKRENVSSRFLIGSPLHIRQILNHIVGNAIKYNRERGSVHVSTKELELPGGQLLYEFVVADTGIGMSQDFLEHIFEPFTQEAHTARTNYTGTGLGMAITKNLVEQMGGSIGVESVLGEGSTFTLLLPFRQGEEAAEEPCEPAAVTETDIIGMRVLLVEDNPLNQEIAQYILEDAGAVVVHAENGEEAVHCFREAPPYGFDCILMDVMMPIMDGLEATRQIRAMNRADAGIVPIIAMTANAFVEDVEKALKAGMNQHLAKPLDMNRLLQVLTAYYHHDIITDK